MSFSSEVKEELFNHMEKQALSDCRNGGYHGVGVGQLLNR